MRDAERTTGLLDFVRVATTTACFAACVLVGAMVALWGDSVFRSELWWREASLSDVSLLASIAAGWSGTLFALAMLAVRVCYGAAWPIVGLRTGSARFGLVGCLGLVEASLLGCLRELPALFVLVAPVCSGFVAGWLAWRGHARCPGSQDPAA